MSGTKPNPQAIIDRLRVTVSFDLPRSTYRVLAATATAHGVEVGDVLNWISVEALPTLIDKEHLRGKALEEAIDALAALRPLPQKG